MTQRYDYTLTDAGRASQPATITWKEFKEQGNPIYKAWVNNQCIVRFSERKVEHILSDKSVKLEDWAYEQIMLDQYMLTIRWLPAVTPASEPETVLPQTVNTIRYGTPEFEQLERDDCEREVARLQAELASAKAENARLETLLQQILINAPYDEPKTIEKPKLLLAQAWAFWEVRQRILLFREMKALTTPANDASDGGKV